MTRRLVVSGLALLLAGCPDPVAQCKATCNGCCSAEGTCEAGTSRGACGELGAMCVSCAFDQVCNPTRCTARPPIDAGADAGTDGGLDAGVPAAVYQVGPTTPMFEACATRDFAGAPVPDVFPDLEVLTIRNVGNAPGTPSLMLTGGGAEAFFVDGGVGLLEPDAGASLEVRFSPPDAGVWVAQLRVGNATSTFAGTVLPNPPVPLLQPQFVTGDGSFSDCNRMGACTQAFTPTLYGDTSTRELQLTNLGCPALKVTGIEIIPAGSAFTLETPAIPPAPDRPIVLTLTGNMQATKLKVHFAPVDDGSGNPVRAATLRLLTNDRTVKDGANTVGGYDVALTGNGVPVALKATPVSCNYSDALDGCGNAPKQANTAHFVLSNTTNGPVLINEAVFKNGSAAASAGGRFTLPAALAGSVIGPMGTMAFDVTYSAQPLFVQDQLVVAASVPGADAGTLGRTGIALAGGNPPCLSTVPAVLDFQNPSAATTTKIVTVRNAPGCGALTLTSLTIDPNPHFSLFPPILQPGMTLNPGQNVDATVKYTKPAAGGNQAGVLRIQSNDPAYLAPQGLVVPLYSATPVDPAPVAVIKACHPNDAACAMPFTTVSLASLPNGPAGTKLVTLDGNDSYDPPSMATKATSFKYRLVTSPGSSTLVALTGLTASATPTATLTVDVVGLYRVLLTVTDAGGQTASATLTLTVTP